MDYKKVLQHFMQNTQTRIIRRDGKRSLITMKKKTKKVRPKLQVVIPAEAATKRAESELKEDIKRDDDKKLYQSTTNHQRSKKLAKRGTKEIKEAKDIFSKRWRKL